MQRQDILNNLEEIKELVIKAKKIDQVLLNDLFVMEKSIQNDQFNRITMKRIFKILLQKYENDQSWLKSVTSSMEIVGWMQIKEDTVVNALKTIINGNIYSLYLKIYATETLLKLDSKKSNKKGNTLLLDDDKELIHKIVNDAYSSTEKDVKEIAVRVLSIPGAV